MKRYLFIGWWSLWHITPLLSLIKYSRNKKMNCDILLWWNSDSIESKVALQNSIDFLWIKWVTHKKYNKFSVFSKVLFQIKKYFYIILWIFSALKLLQKDNFSAILFTGNNSWISFIIAAFLLNLRIVIIELNTVEGKTNNFLKYFIKNKLSFFPIRWWIKTNPIIHLDLIKNNFSIKTIKTQKKLTNIVVSWGSVCGTNFWISFIDFCRQNKELIKNFYIIIILWQKTNTQTYKTIPWNIKIYNNIDFKQISAIYRNSDISITRWWINSLIEQNFFSIKKIIIPITKSSNNHQIKNAVHYKNNWDIILYEKDYKNLKKILSWFIWYKKPYKKENENIKIKKNILSHEQILWYLE